jgi:hypothetical protein
VSEETPQNESLEEQPATAAAADDTSASPKRPRRRFVPAAIIVVLVVLLVVLPLYFALQPKFMRRYQNMQKPYETLVTSAHAEASCQSCHVSPSWWAQGVFGARMLGEFYLSIINPGRQPQLFGPPPSEACARCHVDLRTVSPTGDLNIPHRAHTDVLKVPCVKCHKYLVHEKSPEGKNVPRMATCLECHDGEQAKNNCSACHTEKALPANHKAPDWIVVHPQKQNEVDCAKCHKWTENWCGQCHSTRPRSHTATWRKDHGAAVKKRRNCETCHDAAFCIECHGVVPPENYDPSVKLVR